MQLAGVGFAAQFGSAVPLCLAASTSLPSRTVTARFVAAGNTRVTVAVELLVTPCEFCALYVNVYVPAALTVALNPPFASTVAAPVPGPVRATASDPAVVPATVNG